MFVIGGASAFNEALDSPQCKKVYLTRILKEVPCDAYIVLPDAKQYRHDPEHKVEV